MPGNNLEKPVLLAIRNQDRTNVAALRIIGIFGSMSILIDTGRQNVSTVPGSLGRLKNIGSHRYLGQTPDRQRVFFPYLFIKICRHSCGDRDTLFIDTGLPVGDRSLAVPGRIIHQNTVAQCMRRIRNSETVVILKHLSRGMIRSGNDPILFYKIGTVILGSSHIYRAVCRCAAARVDTRAGICIRGRQCETNTKKQNKTFP